MERALLLRIVIAEAQGVDLCHAHVVLEGHHALVHNAVGGDGAVRLGRQQAVGGRRVGLFLEVGPQRPAFLRWLHGCGFCVVVLRGHGDCRDDCLSGCHLREVDSYLMPRVAHVQYTLVWFAVAGLRPEVEIADIRGVIHCHIKQPQTLVVAGERFSPAPPWLYEIQLHTIVARFGRNGV